MIGKITTGKGAGGTISYVCQKDGAQVLSSTWTGPHEGWAAQFKEHSGALNPGLTEHGQSVVHVSLNAAPGEHLSDDQWCAVAEEYLARMGWGEHDHAVVRHTDAGHDHVHIILSRVGHDGQTADLHNDFPRQERVLDSIERDFSLTRTHEQIRIAAEKDPYRAIESVTRSALTFDRSQVDRYFERLGFEHDKVRELTDSAMRDARVLFASTAGGSDKFTTREVVAEVRQLDSALRSLAGQEARPVLDRGESAREGLDAGQRAAADRIAAGGGLVVIEGFAGAGKSTMLRAASEDLKFSGHDVIGVAPSGKAAKGLEQSAGIESGTLTKTLMQIESGERKLTADTVVIVDEAGMARNDDLGKLAQHVADAGGRLVLVGDERQLGAVGRGGGFAEACEIAGRDTARLDEIHRQREGWQREASRDFGEGRAAQAIQRYIDHGRVEWAASRGTARDMLVSDYVREIDKGTNTKDMLALAHENRDVRAMNAEIRDAIKERGGLQGERIYKLEGADGKTQKIGIAVGDRVVFDKNSRDAGGKEVKNGEFGTVTKTDSKGFTVEMDGGGTRRVEDGARQQMSHGYSSSIHKSQGATVDKTFVLGSKGMDSQLTYVSMSRQKEDTKMYANKTEFKNDEHLKNSLGRDNGREAFKSVREAGDGRQHQAEHGGQKESAQSRAADRDHGAGREPAGEKARGAREPDRERQPVNAYIAAAAIDQGKMKSGLERQAQGQGQQAQGKGGEQSKSQGQQQKGQSLDQGQQAGQHEKGQGQGQGQAKAQDQHQLPKDQAQQKDGPAQGKGQQAQGLGQQAQGKGGEQSKSQGQGQHQQQDKGQQGKGKGESKSSNKSKGYGL